MARPRNADSQRTRQAILDAALALFSERGFFGASLRDIAGAVGVRESALYHYFPSKDALFEALIAADQDTRRERLAAVLDEPDDDPRPRWNASRTSASSTSPRPASSSCSAS